MQELSRTDLEHIMIGCTFLGTGGGGSLEIGRQNLQATLEAGHTFRLMSVDEMGDDDYAASPYDVGSLEPPSNSGGGESSGGEENTQTVAAYKALMNYMDKHFTAVAIGEIGPESTAAALIVAAKLGLVSLDADGIGRAAPEILQYSVLVAGLSTLPAAGVSKSGDEIIITKLSDSSQEEKIFRAIAAQDSYVSVADAPMPGSVARKPGVLVTGSISLCLRIGSAFEKAKHDSEDPIKAVIDAAEGLWLFEGTVKESESRDEDGFTKGSVVIEGSGDHQGETCHITFQNENLVALIGNTVLATVPDLITVVDRESSMPVENPQYKKGQAVVIVGFPANKIWRTKKGLEAFGPEHFDLRTPDGKPISYETIEERYAHYERERRAD